MATGLHGVTAMAIRMATTALLAALALSASAQAVRYIHTDSLGSVAVVTDQNRNVLERREYEPYGLQLTPAIKDGPGYTGHVQDAATGLTYMQQRYYDPLVGLFLSVDPVTAYTDPMGYFNRYKYANNNPYRFTDPDGRQSLDGVKPPSTGIPFIDWLMTPSDARGSLRQMMEKQFASELSQPQSAKDVVRYAAIAMSAGAGAAGGGTRVLASAEGKAGATAELAEMSGMLRDAASGKGNFGIGIATSEQADVLGRAWVGSGARQNSSGNALISRDGLRQYRFPSEKPNSPYASTGVQANFESRSTPDGRWTNNAHLDIEQKK